MIDVLWNFLVKAGLAPIAVVIIVAGLVALPHRFFSQYRDLIKRAQRNRAKYLRKKK